MGHSWDVHGKWWKIHMWMVLNDVFSWDLMILYGGVLSHGGTSSYHPFVLEDVPWNKPSSYWGTPISGNPAKKVDDMLRLTLSAKLLVWGIFVVVFLWNPCCYWRFAEAWKCWQDLVVRLPFLVIIRIPCFDYTSLAGVKSLLCFNHWDDWLRWFIFFGIG